MIVKVPIPLFKGMAGKFYTYVYATLSSIPCMTLKLRKYIYIAAAERYWLGLKVTRSQCVVKHSIICEILMPFKIYNLIKFPNIVYFMSRSPIFNHEGVAAP